MNENHTYDRYNNILMSELTNIITNRFDHSTFFPISQQTPTNVMQNSLYEKNPYKKVTSIEGLSQLKTIIFKDIEQNTKECSITQDEFTEGQEIIQLPCKHIYEKEAIHTWLKEESNSCPVCRYELKFKEVIQKSNSEYDDMPELVSDDDMPELVSDDDMSESDMPGLVDSYEQNERENVLFNINRIMQNIQLINEPRGLYRQNSFQTQMYNTDNDLQRALMDSLHESNHESNYETSYETNYETSYEQKNSDEFLTHPDTQHDCMYGDILSDIDSDDELLMVD
tara:strand:+ start:2301 stop:3149 length:849 start_codon:yes stop_codon:yes gene_type:complete